MLFKNFETTTRTKTPKKLLGECLPVPVVYHKLLLISKEVGDLNSSVALSIKALYEECAMAL